MTVAILSTGDEIINGDIQNTTTRDIAHILFSHNVQMGNQLTTSDDHQDMLNAMAFLFSHHDCLIVTGGLGPTSDDRTRYAMAKYFDESLVSHEECWTHIIKRHEELGIQTDDANRQQSLFPQKATLFHNAQGTAYGCEYKKNNKTIYLLPGPPNECLPMFEQYTLPLLKVRAEKTTRLYRWLLFGVPEAEIASKVDQALDDIACETSYRWYYPYIEVKLKVSDLQLDKAFFDEKLMPLIHTYLICPAEKTALTVLQEGVNTLSTRLVIDDRATHGALESALTAPGLQSIEFRSLTDEDQCGVTLEGLVDYWSGSKLNETENIKIRFFSHGKTQIEEFPVSLKKTQILRYVLEYISFRISVWLRSDL